MILRLIILFTLFSCSLNEISRFPASSSNDSRFLKFDNKFVLGFESELSHQSFSHLADDIDWDWFNRNREDFLPPADQIQSFTEDYLNDPSNLDSLNSALKEELLDNLNISNITKGNKKELKILQERWKEVGPYIRYINIDFNNLTSKGKFLFLQPSLGSRVETLRPPLKNNLAKERLKLYSNKNIFRDRKMIEFNHRSPYRSVINFLKNVEEFYHSINDYNFLHSPLNLHSDSSLHIHISRKDKRPITSQLLERYNLLLAFRLLNTGETENLFNKSLLVSFNENIEERGLIRKISSNHFEIRVFTKSVFLSLIEIMDLLETNEEDIGLKFLQLFEKEILRFNSNGPFPLNNFTKKLLRSLKILYSEQNREPSEETMAFLKDIYKSLLDGDSPSINQFDKISMIIDLSDLMVSDKSLLDPFFRTDQSQLEQLKASTVAHLAQISKREALALSTVLFGMKSRDTVEEMYSILFLKNHINLLSNKSIYEFEKNMHFSAGLNLMIENGIEEDENFRNRLLKLKKSSLLRKKIPLKKRFSYCLRRFNPFLENP